MSTTERHEIIIFYKYTYVADPAGFVKWHKKVCSELQLLGRVLIAHEGINGTLEGTTGQLAEYERLMHAQDGTQGTFGDLSDLWFKHSPGTGHAFSKLKIKVRKEIVTLGVTNEDIDPNKTTGIHIAPEELKAWITNGEDFEIIDMRNEYEYAVGHFRNSINPNIENFRDLPHAIPKLASHKTKKVLAVCTYGVRCEKATGLLKKEGFKDVYQLKGGIGTYMKAYPGEDFLGSLFVFDDRMTENFTDKYEVVGKCAICALASEHFTNCSFPECHSKMIVCESCIQKETNVWCSAACRQKAAPQCANNLQ